MPNANLGPGKALGQRLSQIEANQRNAATTPWLLNASTGQGGGVPGITIDTNGVHAFDASGNNIVGMLTADGSITAYDSTGNAVARFGPLTNSNPGSYGIEVKYNGSWVQVGAGNVDWTNISNKPATFPPSAHTHAGTDITSAVADASGSSHAYNYNVGGTSFFAVWVGSDNLLGKNTSSARYKDNIRQHRVDPQAVLNLEPVLFERKHNGQVTEYGLIAEQVAEHVPELAQWFHGHIDNVRYDLLSVALLSVVKDQERRLRILEGRDAPPAPEHHAPARNTNNAPAQLPEPHPYTIQPR